MTNKYLLDTNICIHWFRGKFNINEKLKAVGPKHCFISEITFAELYYGAAYSKQPAKNFNLIDGLLENVNIITIFDAIPIYSKEKARLRKEGRPISDFDLFIGATAITENMIMVTQNILEFERLNGIILENWAK